TGRSPDPGQNTEGCANIVLVKPTPPDAVVSEVQQLLTLAKTETRVGTRETNEIRATGQSGCLRACQRPALWLSCGASSERWNLWKILWIEKPDYRNKRRQIGRAHV